MNNNISLLIRSSSRYKVHQLIKNVFIHPWSHERITGFAYARTSFDFALGQTDLINSMPVPSVYLQKQNLPLASSINSPVTAERDHINNRNE